MVIWERHRPGEFVPCVGQEGYHSHVELTTDSDGRFTIPWKLDLTPPLYCPLQEPKLVFFKGTYGPWALKNDREVIDKGAPPVILLWPLRNVEERAGYMRSGRPDDYYRTQTGVCCWNATRGPEHPLPDEEIPRYLAVVNSERTLLGLPPFYMRIPQWLENLREGAR